MNFKFLQTIPALIITLAILVVLNIISSALMPAFGIIKLKLTFSILVILFMAFKVETPFLPIFILIMQIFNSAFSAEGWAHGTFAGILVCMVISYVKEMLHFETRLSTMVVTQIFQLIWFILVNSIVYMRLQNLSVILEKFWWFVPESLFISLISPFFYSFMEKIWKVSDSESGVIS